ncbi:hypothetical protein [Methanolobus profundi]|uniref:Uncharacterized protein n=1 Tax=Methanolobus profundi TaxID=487685 RepID=A0A1I4PL56_9EURY|nr:hypothetical protein [Methanolobus profundi]SFM28488.1 hypothetical protein SAMN04488696_0738 [Methanolobus profundi]
MAKKKKETDEFELPEDQKKAIDDWIRANILPQRTQEKTYASYALKLLFEESPDGFFITNPQFKEAMLRCGFSPVNKNKLNWDFRVSIRSTEKK